MVKAKSAVIQYEERIAELYAASADVGEFGHLCKLFLAMLSAVCAYIDKKTLVFLSTPLQNTGMPPHFYVMADKSTNHQITNQVTVICPVVNGRREDIVLNAREVYTSSDGTGCACGALANSIYCDLKKNAGLKGEQLLQVQGRVPFIDGMNEPVMKLFDDGNDCVRSLLEPVQWRRSWLDVVWSRLCSRPVGCP